MALKERFVTNVSERGSATATNTLASGAKAEIVVVSSQHDDG